MKIISVTFFLLIGSFGFAGTQSTVLYPGSQQDCVLQLTAGTATVFNNKGVFNSGTAPAAPPASQKNRVNR